MAEDLQNEFVATSFTEIWNRESGEKTISLSFDSMLEAKYLSIVTDEIEEYNSTQPTAATYKGWYAFLMLESDAASESQELTLKDDVAEVTVSSTAVPEGTTFTFQKVGGDIAPAYYSEYTADGYRRFAKDDDSCVIYNSALMAGGQRVESLSGQATIKVKLPDNFNMKTTTALLKRCDGVSLLNAMSQYIDEDEHAFIYTTSQAAELTGTWTFIDYGTYMSHDEVKELGIGTHKVEIQVSHASYNFRPSMANQSVVDNTGYIVVSADESGNKSYQLFYEMEPVIVSTITGYMTGEAYCDSDNRNDYTDAEVLEYFADASGSLGYDAWAKEHHFQYLKRLSFPLETPVDNNGYLIRFTVPAMDVQTGDGSGVQWALLRVRNAESVEDNPLEGYDKSVLKAVIDKANLHLETLDKTSQEWQNLTNAITVAQTSYDSNPDSTEIVKQREALLKVLKESGGVSDGTLADGVYELPFTILNSQQETSPFAQYFSGNAILKMEDGKMTVTLTGTPLENGSDYVNYFFYDDGNGTSADKEAVIAENAAGIPETYQITRNYTDEPFDLSLKSVTRDQFAYSCSLELDFSQVQRKKASEEEITALKKAIETAKTITNTDYTSGSYQTLQAAIEKAETYLELDEPSYDIVSSQTKALEEAANGLVSLVDLRTKIVEAAAISSEGYTAASYETLAVRLAEAREVLATAAATKTAVEEALKQLTAAMEGLTLKGEDKVNLADGEYDIPATIYKQGMDTPASSNSYLGSAELKVENGNMTVKLN
ncbi:MAG: NEAT domain-containing protein, partial [Lachnospiraceae bacterium]|nr:NEAT domain-containing protein [Lachnospiraceae bacterium]